MNVVKDATTKMELIEMLDILRNCAISDGVRTTLVNDVSLSSFQWVIDKAIECIKDEIE